MLASEISEDEMSGAAGCSYQFGRFQLRQDNGQLTLFSDGHAIALSTAEATILRVLLEQDGQFVKTDDLLKFISQSPVASENLVHGAVRGLRRTLNDAELIKNERSKGYRFAGEFERQSDVGLETNVDSLGQPGISDFPAPDILLPAAQRNAEVDRKRDPFVVVALLVTAPVILLPFGLFFFGGNWESLPRQLGFIQALMILVALGCDLYFADNRLNAAADNETRRGLLAVQQLRRFWRLLLVCWCCLYIVLPFSQWFPPPLAGQVPSSQWQALQIIATLLNNASALMLVMCYVVLNRPTVTRVADRDVEDISLTPGLSIIGALALFEALLVMLAAYLGHADYAADVLFGFDLLSGVAGGIAMALCISRLDSRLLGTSGLLPIVPIVLYAYVVIQPFYPLINRTLPNRLGLNQHFDLWIIQLAFMLKSVMYIYVTRLFRTERFLFYMIHARRVYENADTEWSSFKSKEAATFR
jgi:DNA-binding winged helix-turn-helix (wHTH) protein